MKHLKLPEHYEVGDLVQTVKRYNQAGQSYWLPEYENVLCFVTEVDWGSERICVYCPYDKFLYTGTTSHSFRCFKLIKKMSNKLVRLVFA